MRDGAPQRASAPRICIDVSPAVHHRGGIGRYAQELATALAQSDPEHDYTLFYNRAAEAAVDGPLDCLPHLTTPLADKPWRLRVLLAHLAALPQDRLFPGVDIFHATDHLLPRLARAPSVFTLHDLAFRFYPQTHTRLNRWYLALMMPRFLRAAGLVVVPSESTRRDAVRLYGLYESKVRVIAEGVDARFRPAGAEALASLRARLGLPEHFVLFVGTIEPRKNLARLLEAYQALAASGVAHLLVIAGRRGWRSEGFDRRLHKLGLERRVVLPGYIAEADLPALYSAADALVFPSLYEGFGLPVLEAMACGTPVVCSDAASLPEVAGGAALCFPAEDTRALAQAMGRVLSDEALRSEMRALGLRQAERFTWRRAARDTAAVYDALLGLSLP